MAFVKVENGIVVVKQPDKRDGFIEAPDTVVCGFLYDGQNFSPPAPQLIDWGPVDQEALNSALIAEGSVLRALGLIVFEEINKLRVKNGDAAYTMNQFKTALKAKMR